VTAWWLTVHFRKFCFPASFLFFWVIGARILKSKSKVTQFTGDFREQVIDKDIWTYDRGRNSCIEAFKNFYL
jgi:hypothetical protein